MHVECMIDFVKVSKDGTIPFYGIVPDSSESAIPIEQYRQSSFRADPTLYIVTYKNTSV